jgi:hypothetical protein
MIIIPSIEVYFFINGNKLKTKIREVIKRVEPIVVGD